MYEQIPQKLKQLPIWTHTASEGTKAPAWRKTDWQPATFSKITQNINGNGLLPCIVFGYTPHPYIILDLDINFNGQHKEYNEKLEGLPLTFLKALEEKTYVEQSISGQGYHAIFQVENKEDIK